MRIALLFPMDSPVMAWNLGRGIVRTMERMGIEVVAIDLPTSETANQRMLDEVKKRVPPIDVLRECDAVIVSGPEHIGPWIEAVYERYEWRNLNVPTSAWLHESCERDDYLIDFEAISWMAREWFFPAVQDAERFAQPMFAGGGHSHWMPIGVDTEIFQPAPACKQDFPVAFIGLLYPKRLAYLKALSQHQIPEIRFGRVNVEDMDGYRHEECTRRYVENLYRIKAFFNLPALSRLLVGKVTEVLACGGFLLTPQLPTESGVSKNMTVFESGKHLVYYRSSNLPQTATMLREWSSPEKDMERIKIAAEGCREAHANHSLDKRVLEMFAAMELQVPVQ